jgi:hypothetical protein
MKVECHGSSFLGHWEGPHRTGEMIEERGCSMDSLERPHKELRYMSRHTGR